MISQAAIARSQSGQRKSHGLAVDQRARARRIYSAMRQLRQSLRTRSRDSALGSLLSDPFTRCWGTSVQAHSKQGEAAEDHIDSHKKP
jgi:hypothetical protein